MHIRYSRTYILLLLIFILGLILRLYQIEKLPTSWRFTEDNLRDILVAKHIFEYRIFSRISPLSVLSEGLINNSPIYYYLIGIFWLLTNSALGTTLFMVLLGNCTVIFAYLIGSELLSKQVGLIMAFFIAVSSQQVEYSQRVGQSRLLSPLILPTLYFLIYSIKHKSYKSLLLFIFLAFFSLHIHYSVLAIFPAYLFWGVYSYINILKSRKKVDFSFALFPIFEALFMMFTWILLTYKVRIFDQIQFFFLVGKKVFNFNDFLLRIKLNIEIFRKELFTNKFLPLDNSLLVFVVLAGLGLFFVKKRKITRDSIFLFSFLYSFFFTGFLSISIEVLDYHFTPFYPILIICLVFVFFSINTNRIIQSVLLLLTVFLLIKPEYHLIQFPNIYLNAIKIGENILEDYYNIYPKRKKGEIYDLSVLAYNKIYKRSEHYNYPILYFFEKNFKKNIVKLVPYGSNIRLIQEYPKHFYVACEIDGDSVNYCIEDFLKKKPDTFLAKVIDLKENPLNIKLLRFDKFN